jgi:hypothetical protein
MPSGDRKHPYLRGTTRQQPVQHSRLWALVPVLAFVLILSTIYTLTK